MSQLSTMLHYVNSSYILGTRHKYVCHLGSALHLRCVILLNTCTYTHTYGPACTMMEQCIYSWCKIIINTLLKGIDPLLNRRDEFVME